MKRSSVVLVVALSVFLAAASRGDKQHPRQTRRDNRASENETKQPTPAFTIVVQPAPVKVIQQAPSIEKNQAAQKWYERPTITDWGIFGITIAYALISLGLLYATRHQAQLADASLIETRKVADAGFKSAEAAKQSAQTARLALHIDRPFLVPDNFAFADESLCDRAKLLGSEPVSQYLTEHPDTLSSVYVSASFMLRNYGKGPAVIETILGRIAVVKSIDTVPIGDFNECERWVHTRGVLGIGESVQVLSPVSAALGIQNAKAGWIEPDSVKLIIKNQAVLVVYGQVAYRDFFDTLFLSDFCWFYANMAFGANLPSHGFAIQGPKERNRYHQYDTGLSEPE